jgi:Tfp pilus assembly protein PilO
MNQSVPLWAMAIAPVATLLGTMLVVMLGVYLQNRALERTVDMLRAEIGGVHNEVNTVRSEINSLRAEIKQALAEFELRITKMLLELSQRVERLEEARGLIRTP